MPQEPGQQWQRLVEFPFDRAATYLNRFDVVSFNLVDETAVREADLRLGAQPEGIDIPCKQRQLITDQMGLVLFFEVAFVIPSITSIDTQLMLYE